MTVFSYKEIYKHLRGDNVYYQRTADECHTLLNRHGIVNFIHF